MPSLLAGHSGDRDRPGRPPRARIFRQVSLEEFDEAGPFEAVVASRSLHHVPDLDAAVEKVDSVLVRGGLVLLDDYAKERFDGRTAAWYYEHRRTIAVGGGPEAPSSVEECVRELGGRRLPHPRAGGDEGRP